MQFWGLTSSRFVGQPSRMDILEGIDSKRCQELGSLDCEKVLFIFIFYILTSTCTTFMF